jgi:beta-lactamase class A
MVKSALWIILFTLGGCALPQREYDLKHLLESGGNAQVSLAIYDLASGYQLLVRPDIPFHPASTFKLGVMMEVFHQASQGKFSLDEQLLVKNSFLSIADQSEFSLSPKDDSETDLYQHIGERLSLRDLTRRMIVYSSNLATNLLIEKVGAACVTRFMQELGTNDLVIRRGVEDNKAYRLGMNNSATARSLMQILVRLAKRSVVSLAASDEMIAMLQQQESNEGIPARLPVGVKVAHKTGWIDMLYHDAAIVYPPGHTPYVIVAMTSGLSELEVAPALIAGLSQIIYRQLTE